MNRQLEKFATTVAALLGTSWAFLIACLIFVWWLLIAGFKVAAKDPGVFLVEVTNLFVFVHLFIVQRNANKDIKALHLKLDELIATIDGANNELIKAETAPEAVINDLHNKYLDLSNNLEHPTKPISRSQDEHNRRSA